ncbi:MAG: LCP family protein [Actinomycetia bacterium]|nr:LCP family protein [Actinomycetes bacterium]
MDDEQPAPDQSEPEPAMSESAEPEQPAERAPFRPRHTIAQKLVMAVNIVVVIACLGGAGALLYGKHELDNTQAVEQVEIVTTGALPLTTIVGSSSTLPGDTVPVVEDFPPADPNAVNFLIAGSDSNPCVDPDSPWASAADPARDSIGSRSDSIMVMRVDPSTNQAAVLSFPRDLWVKVGGSNKRINSAFVQNDYTLLAQTLFDTFGITVDHYLQIDFCAFKKIVDAVGGVSVPFKTPILDANVSLYIGAGCHTFSGDEALAYVRSRHLKWVDEDGDKHEDRAADFGRISRQQDFLRRMLQAALEKGLYNPTVARALIETLQEDIVRDSGLLSLDEVLSFAGVMRDIDPADIRTYQVESTSLRVGDSAVQKPALKGKNMKAILAIFQGVAPLAGAPVQVFETTTTSTTSTTTTTLKPTTTVATTPTSGTTGGTGTGTTTTVAPTTTTRPTTTTSTTTTTTVAAEPEENVLGDIVPDETIQC